MGKTWKRPNLITETNLFCAGCGHGEAAKLILEALQEMGLDRKAIGAAAVGCGCMIKSTMAHDWIQAQHGRACAVAAGIKRTRPDAFVYTYQGDGDAGAIGIAETIYSAKRNEKFTTIFINNGVFGMTSGQTAPTSIEGQVTTTAVNGVSYDVFGEPLHLAELIATFNVGYVARGSIANYKEVQKTKQYIRKAVECQVNGGGYSFVEIMSPCPTNWKMAPVDAMGHLEKVIPEYFTLGEKKAGEKQ